MPTTDPLAVLNPSIIGQAEKAHAAILKRVLSDTTLDERQWITLQLAASAGDSATQRELVARVCGAAKFEALDVDEAISALQATNLLEISATDGEHLAVTADGRSLMSALRERVAAFVSDAYGAISGEDLATTARVLTEITARLSQALADG